MSKLQRAVTKACREMIGDLAAARGCGAVSYYLDKYNGIRQAMGSSRFFSTGDKTYIREDVTRIIHQLSASLCPEE